MSELSESSRHVSDKINTMRFRLLIIGFIFVGGGVYLKLGEVISSSAALACVVIGILIISGESLQLLGRKWQNDKRLRIAVLITVIQALILGITIFLAINYWLGFVANAAVTALGTVTGIYMMIKSSDNITRTSHH